MGRFRAAITRKLAAQPPRAVLYVAFALTGVGLVLPGTLLPLLVRQWKWGDSSSGALLFLFFAGTSLGALCARGPLGRSLVLGALLVALPCAVLNQLRGVFVFGALFAYGLGLGLVMTSISLFQSQYEAATRLRELVRLNLLWAIGACCGPFVVLRAATAVGLGAALSTYALLVLLAGCLSGALFWSTRVNFSGVPARRSGMAGLPAFFALTLPLATGIEAGVGSWLTSLAAREHHATETIITAATAMWAGLLCSRLLFSTNRVSIGRHRWVSVWFASLLVVGVMLLMATDHAVYAVGGAFCVGAGVGPIYPYLLAMLLDGTASGSSGFLAAGVGSALLPLLIGQVSAVTHSLRLGLWVPLLAAITLTLLLALRVTRNSRIQNTERLA